MFLLQGGSSVSCCPARTDEYNKETGAGKGVEKSDTATSLFGISLLVMSKDKRIAKILSLRQPLPEEKTKLMK